MTPDAMIFWYVVVCLAALSAVPLYYEQRQKSFGPTPSAYHIFRCEQCGYVYTDDPDVDRSRCQQCGTLNEAIKF